MYKITFITPWGIYYYWVMPFGLKKVGATFQKAATTLLHNMIHKEVKIHINDMIVKSNDRDGHLIPLREFFKRLRKFKMWLNTKKFAFEVTSRKLLGSLTTRR